MSDETTLWKVTGQLPLLAVLQLTVMLWPLPPVAPTKATISVFGTVV
jgi:hypothetical protein